MGTVLGAMLGIWFWVGFFSSPYFWFKKTDRSQAPIARRLMAFGYGLAWPYLIYRYFAGQRGAAQAEAERREAEARILRPDSSPPARQTPASNGSTSRIQNPFDN
jgi:hypothetical protein